MNVSAALALFPLAVAAVVAVLLARGLVTGRAAMKGFAARRASNPAGYWAITAFNLALVAILLFVGVAILRGGA